MRAAAWKRLVGPTLAQTDTEWAFAKTLAYIGPVGWVVHGVLAEDAGTSQDEFYLWVVQMPLTLPADGAIDLSWSDRFGGAARTYAIGSPGLDDAISAAATEVIDNERNPSPLIVPPGGADNVRMQEARSYGLLLSGNAAGALEVLRRIRRYDATYRWEVELVERADAVAALIESRRVDEAMQLLGAWRRENCRSLGLWGD